MDPREAIISDLVEVIDFPDWPNDTAIIVEQVTIEVVYGHPIAEVVDETSVLDTASLEVEIALVLEANIVETIIVDGINFVSMLDEVNIADNVVALDSGTIGLLGKKNKYWVMVVS